MDATRPRRTRDRIRQGWYARQRSLRFARHLGFPLTVLPAEPEAPPCPLLVVGNVFAHVAHFGVLTSLLWASLTWRSSKRLYCFPLLFGGR